MRALMMALLVLLGMLPGIAGAQSPTAPALSQGASGLPVPRFVSLKSDRVHVRAGPGTSYPISWVFQRVGLPVEIIKEFDTWRQVRDSEGAVGWVFQGLLSGRRTALVLPWEAPANLGTSGERPTASVFAAQAETSNPLAIVEAGALVNILKCDGNWCRISIKDQRGWMQQRQLWGVYEREAVD